MALMLGRSSAVARAGCRSMSSVIETAQKAFLAPHESDNVEAAGYPPFLLSAPKTEASTLANGLRVAAQGGHGETATVGVWIDAGSRYETDENNGAAHFLEHMAFKGTPNRTRMQLEQEIENIGGHLNAYTSREHTVYYAKVFKDNVPKAMEILSDILLNSNLDDGDIERERGVILREMQEVQMQTEEVVFDCLHETAFNNQGLGKTILGPKENIEKLSRQQLKDYITTHYTAPRMVVAGAGAIEHSQLVDLSSQYFGDLPTQPPAGFEVPSDQPRYRGSHVDFREDNMPVAHVAVGVQSAGWTSPHAFDLMVMQTLLGNWDRSRSSGRNGNSELAQACANDELCHSYMSYNTCYKDTGLFGIYFVAEPKKVQDMAWNAMNAMVRMCHQLTEDEVERAKTQCKANMLLQLDGTSAICEEIGRQMLTYNRRMSPAEIFARIDAVNIETVTETAKEFINDEDPVVSAVGNTHELPDYNWFRRRTFYLRY